LNTPTGKDYGKAMHKWYVVQAISSQEKKAKKNLEEHREHKGMTDLIERVVLPIEKVSEVKNGQQRIVEKRLWPGYLLVKMTLTDESWSYVKNTVGVVDFLGGDQPSALTEKEVEEILKDLEDKKQTVTQRHKINVGDRVKIVDGVFVNFIGTVTEVFHDKGRLSVLVSIFGRDTRVDDLEFVQVEEISAEAENI
jgi:transcriptional antiterminator NusG